MGPRLASILLFPVALASIPVKTLHCLVSEGESSKFQNNDIALQRYAREGWCCGVSRRSSSDGDIYNQTYVEASDCTAHHTRRKSAIIQDSNCYVPWSFADQVHCLCEGSNCNTLSLLKTFSAENSVTAAAAPLSHSWILILLLLPSLMPE